MNTQSKYQELDLTPQYLLTRKTAFILLLVTILVLSMFSCNESPKEKVNDAATAVMESKEDYIESKEDYKTEIENYKKETNDKIAENDKKLQDYKIKVASDKSKTNKEYQLKISELEKKNLSLKNRVNAFEGGDKVNWEAFKLQCSEEMKNLTGDICNVCGPKK